MMSAITIESILVRVPIRGLKCYRDLGYVCEIYPQNYYLKPDSSDFSLTNHNSTRGVFNTYFLKPSRIYEIHKPINYSKYELLYCLTNNGNIEYIQFEDIDSCKQNLTKMFMKNQ
jgi:hypothetical protein